MSNHFLPQQYEFLDGQMLHMDHLPDRVDSVTAELQSNNMVGHVSHNPALQFAVSNEQLGSVEPMSSNSGFQNPMASNNQLRQVEPKAGSLGFGAGEVMMTNLDSQKAILPSKRKAEMDATAYSVSRLSMMPNRHRMQIGTSSHFSQLLQPSSPTKNSMQMQPKVGPSDMQNLPASNKKMVRNESLLNRSGSHQVQTPKGRTTQNEQLSKVKTDSFGAVRSKMREQLAAALTLATQNQDKTANPENNGAEASTNHQTVADSQPPESDLGVSGMHQLKHQDSSEPFPSEVSCSAGKSGDVQGSTGKGAECMGNPPIFDDVSFSDNFFVKDDLLQGNGLSWALDLDMQVTEDKEKHNAEETKVLCGEQGGNASDQAKPSPENLACEIEAELFKLFGGVNKKYKEKGRSLLFNLKDRNNPDLRERVISGEIAPERLCSMTAEELASKELSKWRMEKAEELAQMVVLPDSDLGRRRLVKKTHKGEYQVEVGEDDSVLVEVTGGSSSLSQTQPKSKDMQSRSPELDDMKDKEKTASEKNNSENQDLSGSIAMPNDGTDLMEGMIGDELKDAEFLPPIISLDEFMESLNSEPPFENLQVDAGRPTPPTQKELSEASKEVVRSDSTSKDCGDNPDKADEVVRKDAVGETVNPSGSPVVQNITPPDNAATVEHIWEGALQLSVSSSIKTLGVFQSGEKTSIAEWPSSLEIKGRVRLGAFEKFIKELPLSRSRAVMVIHFVLKDDTDESERANLREAIESYVSDDRLGFAEPNPGIELYLCPTRGRIVDMLSNYLSSDRTDIFNSSDDGLIGVIVWRKAHQISAISSPNTSHQKHASLKRQLLTSRRQQDKDANVNAKMMNKVSPAPYNRPPSHAVTPAPSEDNDTDIPPGFGPAAAAPDDDDLPEFNFSGNVNANNVSTPRTPSSQNLRQGPRVAPSNPAGSRPVDQIRELIHKYGQTSASDSNSSWSDNRGSAISLGIEPWNDDDDDIPEWQPQAPHQLHQPRTPSHGIPQPLRPTYSSQNTVPLMVQKQLIPTMMPSQGGRWAQQPGNPGNGGHYNRLPGVGVGPRQDSSRSRGF